MRGGVEKSNKRVRHLHLKREICDEGKPPRIVMHLFMSWDREMNMISVKIVSEYIAETGKINTIRIADFNIWKRDDLRDAFELFSGITKDFTESRPA